jgi:serine/threonine-protein kinase
MHRDLKPGNIMLGKYGETLVVDWGLAKPVGKPEASAQAQEPTLRPSSASGSAETLPGSAMGTPQYMSPEQAAGELDRLGPASDVYSLGATLYCLLTGKAAFHEADVGVLLQRVQNGDFPPPRKIDPLVPPALEAVCLKAMARAPEDRYGSPRHLADDIEQWLADEAVSAWSEPWTQRLGRWARRHRVLVEIAAFALVFVVICSTLAALLLGRQAQREHEGRLVAEQLREKGMRVAAQLAARSLAYEIDLRWWILKGAADDAELRQHVRALAPVEQPRTHPAWKDLQAWIKERFTESARTKATSWFVTDHQGRHLARHPPDEKLVGKSFAFRDYFHGLGRDFPEGTLKEPIQDVHRSVVFESQATGNHMVTFSVPIWGGQPRASEIVGVVGMSVELGEFAGLRIADPNGRGAGTQDRIAVLVDAREDWLEGRAQNGLILQHPWLEEMRRVQPKDIPMLRLEPHHIERIDALRQRRLDNEASTAAEELDRNYHDPAGGAYSGRWLGAFEPVFVEGRPDKVRDTGWVVIVQER